MATISDEQDAQNLICQALLDAFPMADRVADNYAAVAVKALRSQAEVSAKPLEWERDQDDWLAPTPFATYRISPKHVLRYKQSAHPEANFWLYRAALGAGGKIAFVTLDEAKDAAQKDYLERVLACLANPAAPQGDTK